MNQNKIMPISLNAHRVSIAPMLDWTDRHFRYFLRFICKNPVFYTEMLAAPAVVLGNREKLLQFNSKEEPLVLQLGGSDPVMMAQCASIAKDFGYRELNINAGCPSSRVQAGCFGAVLMKTPEVVADCLVKMRAVSNLPVSVKTRICLSDVPSDGFNELFKFADLVRQAGCHHLIVHARKARLNLSPKENRGERLPLNYEVVYRLKKSFPDMLITINGNIFSLEEGNTHLGFVDGVMFGRWAYANPYGLKDIDGLFYNDSHPIMSRKEILQNMIIYMQENKDKLSIICPHLAGLFYAEPFAKQYKQILMSRDLESLQAFCDKL